MMARCPVDLRLKRTASRYPWEDAMAVVKVVELLAESKESWEDAARQAVAEATESIRGVRSVYISEFQAIVENDKVSAFRVNAKVSFVLEKGGTK
jgi:flavin-binding protein dodecin